MLAQADRVSAPRTFGGLCAGPPEAIEGEKLAARDDSVADDDPELAQAIANAKEQSLQPGLTEVGAAAEDAPSRPLIDPAIMEHRGRRRVALAGADLTGRRSCVGVLTTIMEPCSCRPRIALYPIGAHAMACAQTV